MVQKCKNKTLYIGVLYQKDETEDFVDILFVTMSQIVVNKEMENIKKYAQNTLKLKCEVNEEGYKIFKSINERSVLEVFVVERILVVGNNGS